MGGASVMDSQSTGDMVKPAKGWKEGRGLVRDWQGWGFRACNEKAWLGSAP